MNQQIAPVVRKLGLLDWYTSYELQVRLLPHNQAAGWPQRIA